MSLKNSVSLFIILFSVIINGCASVKPTPLQEATLQSVQQSSELSIEDAKAIITPDNRYLSTLSRKDLIKLRAQATRSFFMASIKYARIEEQFDSTPIKAPNRKELAQKYGEAIDQKLFWADFISEIQLSLD